MYLNNEKPKSIKECLERLKKGCEILKVEYDYPDCGRFNSPAAEKEIQKYERFLGFHFPDAYRQFLKFSNGAWILKNEIYGLNSIGRSDDYVPDDYFALSFTEMIPERLAISKTNGQICMFYELKPEPCKFENYLLMILTKCEEYIIEEQGKKAEKAKTSAEMKRDEENLVNYIAEMQLFFKKRNDNENIKKHP